MRPLDPTCRAVRTSLHSTIPSQPSDPTHLAVCPACAGVAAAYGRVDGAIAGLVPPGAPLDLPARVRSAVALRRAADARWARALSLVLVAAAVLVVVGVTVPVGEVGAPSGWPDAARAALQGTLDEVEAGPAARVGAVLGALGDYHGVSAPRSTPFGPLPDLTGTLLLLAVAAPLLVVLNRALSRRHPEVA